MSSKYIKILDEEIINETNYTSISDENDSDIYYNDILNYEGKKVKNIKKKNKVIIMLKVIFSVSLIFIFIHCLKCLTKNKDSHLIPVEDSSKHSKLVKYMNDNTYFGCLDEPDLVLTKGESRKDKNGIELNKYILNGMYSQGIDNIPSKKIEDWSLYTPSCPNLKPVVHSYIINNPKCEQSSLQFANLTDTVGDSYPFNLQLHEISNQLKKYNTWIKSADPSPNYSNQNFSSLLDESYHPYDYGYIDNTNISEIIIPDEMKKIPDPRKRRLFSFISFDFEFELLDVYLSDNYEIVDYFVIFESNSTVFGQPKPLYFTRMLLETDRYDQFKDKLIPVPYVMPTNENSYNSTREDIENKIMIEEGLRAVNARHGDLFVYGNVGEIPKAHVLSRLKKCGGWEHLYTATKKPIGFSSWSFEYSFENVENEKMGTVIHPNLGIFDIKNSLNSKSKEDDLYKTYVNNNFVENRSFNDSERAILWVAGWSMNTVLPSIDHLYNKLTIEKPSLLCNDEVKVKYDIETKIENRTSIFNESKSFSSYYPKLPQYYTMDASNHNFQYSYWKLETTNKTRPSREFSTLISALKKEIPYQIGNNVICYNYMYERKFGVNGKLWWKKVPKTEWKSFKFDTKEKKIHKLLPWISPFDLGSLKIMSPEETIRDIITNRKSISRFGDGEYSMIMRNHLTCGYQTRDERLIAKLNEILYTTDEKFIIGIPDTFNENYNKLRTDGKFWRNYNRRFGPQLVKFHNLHRVYGSAMISRFYEELIDKSNVGEYVKVLKLLWDKRDVLIIEGEQTRFGVGNDLMDNAKSIQRILCPKKNAFDVYDKIYEEALKQDKDKLILTALGPAATALSYDLHKAGYQVIDIGHADVEYEWFLRKAEKRVRISNKFVDEAPFGNFFIFGCNDKNYKKQIIAKIKGKSSNWFTSFFGF